MNQKTIQDFISVVLAEKSTEMLPKFLINRIFYHIDTHNSFKQLQILVSMWFLILCYTFGRL